LYGLAQIAKETQQRKKLRGSIAEESSAKCSNSILMARREKNAQTNGS
jgi:hypothetical protein